MVKTSARSMKAIAVVALSFLFAGVGATAASADQPDFICPDGVGGWVKTEPVDLLSTTATAPSGKLIAEVCYKAGDNNAFFNVNPPASSVTITSTLLNNGGQIAEISHYSLRLVDKVDPAAVTPVFPDPTPPTCDTDGSLPETPSTLGIVYSWDGNTLKAEPASDDYVFTEGAETSRTYGDLSATGDCPIDDADKISFCHATASDSNPYEYITTSKAAFYNAGHIDGHIDGSALLLDIYPAGTYGDQSWEARGDQSLLAAEAECVVPDVPEAVTPEFPDPTPPTCDTDGSLPETPSTLGVVYSWDGNTLKAALASDDYVFTEGAQTSRTYVLGSAIGYQSTDEEEPCYVEAPVEVAPVFPDPTPPTCDTDGSLPETPSTLGVVYSWDGNTLMAEPASDDYVFADDAQTSRDYGDLSATDDCPIDIELAEVEYAPTWTPICLPNNDKVDFPDPEVAGVTYTDTGWVLGQRTITASADEGYTLLGETSWTFTDTPAAECPDETGFSGTPKGELAYSGPSSSTNGLTALAIFLMATGTMLVGLKTRAVK